LIPETEFKLKRKQVTVPETPASTTTTAIEATHTVIEVEHDPGTVVQPESNTLFMWVLTVSIFIYFMLSVCHRQFKKRRLTTRRKSVSTILQQPEDISLLVTSNPKDS
jgi:hypothetical protein